MEDVQQLAKQLSGRIAEEVEKILREFAIEQEINVNDEDYIRDNFQRAIYPDDPYLLADYSYKNERILRVKFNENGLGVLFETPQKPKEVQDG